MYVLLFISNNHIVHPLPYPNHTKLQKNNLPLSATTWCGGVGDFAPLLGHKTPLSSKNTVGEGFLAYPRASIRAITSRPPRTSVRSLFIRIFMAKV